MLAKIQNARSVQAHLHAHKQNDTNSSTRIQSHIVFLINTRKKAMLPRVRAHSLSLTHINQYMQSILTVKYSFQYNMRIIRYTFYTFCTPAGLTLYSEERF